MSGAGGVVRGGSAPAYRQEMEHPAAVAREPSGASEPVRVVRVALAGCGTVGGSLVRLIQERGPSLERALGLRFELVRILVKHTDRPRAVEVPAGLLTSDADAFVASDADLVVEAVGGLDPAERIARAALESGRRFVTANKALLSARGAELVALARRHGAALDFEAAVGGAIPIVRALRESLPEMGIRSVRGVLNGTSNYILTRLAEGVPFASALDQAQKLGFAEADPTRDLDGRDAADKIALVAWLSFGIDPSRTRMRVRGLLPDPDRIGREAAAFGGVARMVAECVELDHGVATLVEPVIVSASSTLGAVCNEQNLVVVQTRYAQEIAMSGPGAGGFPTASSVFADMVHAAQRLPRTNPSLEGVDDNRAHRWVVAMGPADKGRIRALFDEAGVGVEELRASPDGVRLLTAACDRARLAVALRPLEAAAPLVVRFELA